MAKIICITFGTDNDLWKRPLHHYYVKLQDGTVYSVWAHDACDANDAFNNVVEYGTWR